MKKLILLLSITWFLLGFITAQDKPAESSLELIEEKAFEIFEMKEGDTTYVMKKYYLCIYKSGENKSQGEEELSKLQNAHMAHLSNLAEDDQACIAGPFHEDGDMRGIIIMSVYSKEEAIELINKDPMVKAGRLSFEIHPFWAAKGSKLF